MLNGIHIVDYANHRDTRLTFGRMTALVGQNGSGKTNTLRAILQTAARCENRVPSQNDVGTSRHGSFGWKISAGLDGPFKESKGSWGLISAASETSSCLWRARPENDKEVWIPDPRAETAGLRTWNRVNYFLFENPPENIKPAEIVILENELLHWWNSRYFKTAGSYLQASSYSEEFPPRLQEDCGDLAWVIAYLKGDKDEAFAEIIEALRMVVPIVRKVRHRPVSITRYERKGIVINKQERSYDEEQKVMGQELRFDMASGEDLPASAISEGTLVTLAILTAVMQDGNEPGSQTILLDDIESGLHPKAQRDLVKQLRRLQEARPELQIIFSSHSPYIIDEMKPEEVWLFATDAEGFSRSAKLSDHPDAKRALEVLTTGEFWSAEGEDWVLDPTARQPQPA